MALVAQYLFNGNANDETGTYNGTGANITYESVPSEYNFGGKVAVFNGSSSKITLPNISAISGTNARTFELWFYLPSNCNARNCIIAYGEDSAGKLFTIRPHSGSSDGIQCDLSMNASYRNLSSITYFEKWHHFVFVQPANSKLSASVCYIDSVVYPITSYYGSSNTTINSTNKNYCIGYDPPQGNWWFKGKMANYRIYNEVLTAATVAEHYANESVPAPVNSVNYLDWDYRRHRDCKLVKPLDD